MNLKRFSVGVLDFGVEWKLKFSFSIRPYTILVPVGRESCSNFLKRKFS